MSGKNGDTTVFDFGDLDAPAPYAHESAAPGKEKRAAKHSGGFTLILLGLAAAACLIGIALLGQVRLTELNEETVALSGEILQLREEQNDLRIRYEECCGASSLSEAPASVQPARDEATVLSARKGTAQDWTFLVDILVVSFR